MFIYLLLSGLIILVDQLVKFWTVAHISYMTTQALIPGVVEWFYIQNKGAAWGMLAGKQVLFYLITVLAVVVITSLLYKESRQHQPSKLAQVAYGLLLGGAIGNFVDRIRLGYVVDMFHFTFIDFPIFNVADVALTIGVGILFVYLLFIEKEGKNGQA